MDELKSHVSRVGLASLARRLGVSAQRLSNWLERGVPIDQCTAVELASGGEVMRWHLRTDDWYRIWPELRRRKDAPAVSKAVA